MRLLGAELIKLGRPLTWGVAAAAAVFCVLLAVGGAHNAALEGGTPTGHLPSCTELGIPAGQQCARAEARERARVAQVSAQPAQVAAQLNPLAARALLVLAAFAAIGLLAAVATRGTIGTTAASAVAFIAMLIAASLPGTGRWTPATWVQEWMGFPAGQASITSLPTNFWSRF